MKRRSHQESRSLSAYPAGGRAIPFGLVPPVPTSPVSCQPGARIWAARGPQTEGDGGSGGTRLRWKSLVDAGGFEALTSSLSEKRSSDRAGAAAQRLLGSENQPRDHRSRLFLHRRVGVRVGFQRDSDGGMARALGDDLRMNAGRSATMACVWRRSWRRMAGTHTTLPDSTGIAADLCIHCQCASVRMVWAGHCADSETISRRSTADGSTAQ